MWGGPVEDARTVWPLLVTAFEIFLKVVYSAGAVAVALYGLNALWLTLELLLRPRRAAPLQSEGNCGLDWPAVTVQLPIYNERHVVTRLVDAVAALDYPRDRLQIQILDDSDDDTVALSDEAARTWRQRGVDIDVVRRPLRTGYKAGALAFALPAARGEYIAIFDADFLPAPDFLQRTMSAFLAPGSADIAFVQARWDHVNRDYSLLTRCQALALDGHFGVEQPARRAAGYAFGFNGSAGVWRRSAIEDPRVGGWSADTLCEDLDLAYRAQLAGWRGDFVDEVAAPAELPPQLIAFKRQQARWAKGSVQTLRKLGGRVRRSGWPLPTRIAALFHLGNYLIHPMLLLLLLVTVPMVLLSVHVPTPLAALSLASFGPPLLYAVSQRRLHPDAWLANYLALPLLMFFGMGLSLGNSRAVWQGLRRSGGNFARTPKFHVQHSGDAWRHSSYRLSISGETVIEGFLALYAGLGIWGAWRLGNAWAAAFMALFALGFGLMFGVEVGQSRAPRHARLASRPAPARAAVSVHAKPVTQPLQSPRAAATESFQVAGRNSGDLGD